MFQITDEAKTRLHSLGITHRDLLVVLLTAEFGDDAVIASAMVHACAFVSVAGKIDAEQLAIVVEKINDLLWNSGYMLAKHI